MSKSSKLRANFMPTALFTGAPATLDPLAGSSERDRLINRQLDSANCFSSSLTTFSVSPFSLNRHVRESTYLNMARKPPMKRMNDDEKKAAEATKAAANTVDGDKAEEDLKNSSGSWTATDAKTPAKGEGKGAVKKTSTPENKQGNDSTLSLTVLGDTFHFLYNISGNTSIRQSLDFSSPIHSAHSKQLDPDEAVVQGRPCTAAGFETALSRKSRRLLSRSAKSVIENIEYKINRNKKGAIIKSWQNCIG